MVYDLIIIGAGAAGLFAGASLPCSVNGLILEKKPSPGRKLLMSGSGQCNLTHGGSIKDFISHYGKNGSRIRSVLYQFNNQAVIDFFEKNGVPIFVREDEKVFPKSMKAQDILDVLTRICACNGLRTIYSSPVDQISCQSIDTAPIQEDFAIRDHSSHYTIHCGNESYQTKSLIITTGGCSYPGTGSDGSFFNVIKELNIDIVPTAPALVPIFVEKYPYASLSGIAFTTVEITIGTQRIRDALLLTHNCFSGPGILMISRYAKSGDKIVLNYLPDNQEDEVFRNLFRFMTGNSRQLLTAVQDYLKASATELPKRFLEAVCSSAGLDPVEKSSRVSASQLKSFVHLLFHDEYVIKSLGGFESAMVTAGGVALSEINLKTMESIKYQNIFFAGEVVDIDGDTGGYNLQFAFSSGHLAAERISKILGD